MFVVTTANYLRVNYAQTFRSLIFREIRTLHALEKRRQGEQHTWKHRSQIMPLFYHHLIVLSFPIHFNTSPIIDILPLPSSKGTVFVNPMWRTCLSLSEIINLECLEQTNRRLFSEESSFTQSIASNLNFLISKTTGTMKFLFCELFHMKVCSVHS